MHDDLSSHFEDGLHKAKPAMCICIQKQTIYMHIFRGSLFICMKRILTKSEHSSSPATVVARVVDEEDDATSPTLTALHHDSASGLSAPPNSNVDPAPSSTPTGNE